MNSIFKNASDEYHLFLFYSKNLIVFFVSFFFSFFTHYYFFLISSVMGNSKSKSKKNTPQQQITRVDDKKRIVLVHHSQSNEEKKRVLYFKTVLVQSALGSIDITDTFNLAENQNPRDVKWLGYPQNVVLIRLTPGGINTIEEVARQKGYIDENNQLHGRVLSVAFGNSLPGGWPPQGVSSAAADQRSFCLGQENPEDKFDEGKMRALVSAIVGT